MPNYSSSTPPVRHGCGARAKVWERRSPDIETNLNVHPRTRTAASDTSAQYGYVPVWRKRDNLVNPLWMNVCMTVDGRLN
jgi:hypothetical protein